MIGSKEDPYLLPVGDWSKNKDLLPAVGFPDIYVYLINSPSPHTMESLKAYKSTDARAYFTAGFVDDVMVTRVTDESYIVIAKVYLP